MRSILLSPRFHAFVLCLLLCPALPIDVARAEEFLVNNTSTDPDVPGSLPWAVDQANVTSGGAIINFTPGLGRIHLPHPLMVNGTTFVERTDYITRDDFITENNATLIIPSHHPHK